MYRLELNSNAIELKINYTMYSIQYTIVKSIRSPTKIQNFHSPGAIGLAFLCGDLCPWG